MGGAERGKRNGQIERANAASLFTEASLALSLILLYLICLLKERRTDRDPRDRDEMSRGPLRRDGK